MPALLTTYRSDCGRGRTTFYPHGDSDALPWVCYVDGTATRHFDTAQNAIAYLKSFHKLKFSNLNPQP